MYTVSVKLYLKLILIIFSSLYLHNRFEPRVRAEVIPFRQNNTRHFCEIRKSRVTERVFKKLCILSDSKSRGIIKLKVISLRADND